MDKSRILKAVLLALIVMLYGIASYGQTALSKDPSNCITVWELECKKAKEITEMLAVYPLQSQKINDLEALMASRQKLAISKSDSVKKEATKLIFKAERKVEKAKIWGNIKPTVLAIVAVLIILK